MSPLSPLRSLLVSWWPPAAVGALLAAQALSTTLAAPPAGPEPAELEAQVRLRVLEEERARLEAALHGSVLHVEDLTARLEDLARLDGWSPEDPARGDGSDRPARAGSLGAWEAEAGAAQAASRAWTEAIEEQLCRRSGEVAARPTAWPVLGRVSSTFGVRRDPFTGSRRTHRGLDIAALRGTPVLAAGDGVVELARRRGAYGLCVIVDHGNGLKSLYAHLQRIEVRAGERVARGERIGQVGSTGRAKGAHLHLEIIENGEWIDPLLHVGQEGSEPPWSFGT